MSDWYAANTIQLEKLRTSNRAAMENMDRTFVSQIEPLQPGTEWERCAVIRKSQIYSDLIYQGENSFLLKLIDDDSEITPELISD